MKATLGFILLAIIIIVGGFLAISGLTMLLLNVVLNHYSVTPIDYTASMAIVGLSALLIGGRIGTNNK